MHTIPRLLDVVALLSDGPRTASCSGRLAPSWNSWMVPMRLSSPTTMGIGKHLRSHRAEPRCPGGASHHPRPSDLGGAHRQPRCQRHDTSANRGGSARPRGRRRPPGARLRGSSRPGRSSRSSRLTLLVRNQICRNAREWSLLPGVDQLLVEHRVGIARSLPCDGEILPPVSRYPSMSSR